MTEDYALWASYEQRGYVLLTKTLYASTMLLKLEVAARQQVHGFSWLQPYVSLLMSL